MQIYVVNRGDSVWGIANTFGVAPDVIVRANELPDPDRLVVGQALVIPIDGSYYFVRQGDSLFSIARRFGMTYNELAAINNISTTSPLRIGTRLYIPPLPKRSIESNAYIQSGQDAISPSLEQEAGRVAPLLTYLAPFSYQARRDGTLSPLALGELPQIARSENTSLMLVVTNLEDGAFSDDLARDILQSSAVQNLLLDNIVAELERVGVFSDVHFDFEFLPPELKDSYNNFLQMAVDRLHPLGYMVSSALAPKTSATQIGQWYEAHDYKAHGQIVDFVIIMTYEWGYSGGPPMPVSPIGPVEQVLRFAESQIPAQKIMMGQNLYGYDWRLPYQPGTSARALSPQAAISLALEHNAAIQYDYNAQAPYFYYTDNDGVRHIVWFEDARSIQAKFDLIKRLGIRGISYWRLGFPFPQNWLLLEDNFNIVKKNIIQ